MFKKISNPLTLFRSKSIVYKIESPPKYISKSNVLKRNFNLNRMSQRSFTQQTQTHIPTLMYAKIVFHFKNHTCICIIDGSFPINTIQSDYFNELQDFEKTLNNCYINFTLEHVSFNEQFYCDKKTILGLPFIKKYIEYMDYEKRIIVMKDGMSRLDIYNEIPHNTISICLEDVHFLAIIDSNREQSIISLEILEKMEHYDTTHVELSLECNLIIDHNELYSFNHIFCVVDNRHKYVILGLDFMKKHVFRIGKNYLQLKNGLRVQYLKK